MKASEKLKSLNITLSDAPKPVGAYVAFKKIGKIVYISGQLPIGSDGSIKKGSSGLGICTGAGQNEIGEVCRIEFRAFFTNPYDRNCRQLHTHLHSA